MNKLIDWLTNSFTPKMNKILGIPMINAISSSFMSVLPFILTGSVIYVYNVFRSFIPSLPDLSIILRFSFQLMSLCIAFFIPYTYIGKKGYEKNRTMAGLLSVAVLLMALHPEVDADNMMTISFAQLGPTGTPYALVIAVFVGLIYNLWLKLKFLAESSIPDFVVDWINNIIPILITLFITYIAVYVFSFDLPAFIQMCFTPLFSFGQSYIGFVTIVFIPTFLYSLGISSWTTSGLRNPILYAGTAANIAAVAAGLEPTNIVTYEVVFTMAIITLGGMGATLPLNVLMLRSKAKKLKVLGKVCIGPSIFNINEPIIFGTPVAYNPNLMIPMWINGIVGPTITWFAFKLHLVTLPAVSVAVGQIPAPFSSVMVTGDWRAVILWAVLFVVYAFIWYPGFKAYEKELLMQETTAQAEVKG